MKKSIFGIFCVLLAALNLAAGGGKQSGASSGEGPLEIVYYTNHDWTNASSFANSAIGKELQARTNTKLTYTKAASGDDSQLNLMIASGTLPDLITIDRTSPLLEMLIENDLIYPVSDLIDKYAPEIRNTDQPEYYQYFNYKDGKQYYFTNYVMSPYVLATPTYQAFGGLAMNVIRSDIYEAIGKPPVDSPDNFFNALMAIKQKFPNVDPWYFGPGTSAPGLFQYGAGDFPQALYGLNGIDVINGKLTSVLRNQKFLEYVKWMNKLYTNGLFAPESFADTQEVALAKYAQGTMAVASNAAQFMKDTVPIQSAPNAHWVPISFFGDSKVARGAAGWTATVISKKTKDPERLMKFIAYCVSKEGRLLNGVGIEGVHWDWQTRDGYTVAIVRDEYFKIYQSGMNNQAYKDIGFFDFYAFNDELWSASMSVFIPSLQTPNEKQMADYMKGHIYYNIPMGLITPGASSEEGVIEARLKELTSNYYVQMIMAPNNQEAERIYREFLSRAEGMGLAKLEAVWTQKYVQAGGNPQSEYVK